MLPGKGTRARAVAWTSGIGGDGPDTCLNGESVVKLRGLKRPLGPALILLATLVGGCTSVKPAGTPTRSPVSAVPSVSPTAAMSPSPEQAVSPSPLVATTQTSYPMNVLVLKFFPITPSGSIDIQVTGDVGGSASVIKAHVDAVDRNLVTDLTIGTAYHRFEDPAAKPALRYQIVGSREYDTAVPSVAHRLDPNYKFVPNYRLILSRVGICKWVEDKDVSEVWIWAYQGPHQLGISESKMSGPNGDISNSPELNDMPICSRTYTVYTFNYGRGTAEAMESHGHQFEAEFRYVDANLFGLFEGPNYPATLGVPGRCGSVHNPPNARFEYDRDNPTPHPSDCLDWKPGGRGKLSSISCANWSCVDRGDADNPSVDYIIWWMQNVPGRGNKIRYSGQRLRNWWDVHADFDAVVENGESLTLSR